MIRVTGGGVSFLVGLYGLCVIQATEAAAKGDAERDLPHGAIGITALTSTTTSTDTVAIGADALAIQDQVTGDVKGEMPAAYDIAYPTIERRP